MSDKKQDDKTPNGLGPWDVVMHITQRFPTVALFIGLLAAAYFATNYFQEQREDAQIELAQAREEIAKLRQETQNALNLARDKELEATKAVEKARAEILEQVQSTTINTATRVQKLIQGQLSSMESLENVQTSTAKDIAKQLIEFRVREQEFKERLLKAEASLGVSNLNFAIERLQSAIVEQSRELFSQIKLVANSFEISDNASVAELKRRINMEERLEFRLSLTFALYLNDNSPTTSNQLVEMFKRTSEMSSEFLNALLDCCDKLNSDIALKLLPDYAEKLINSNESLEKRIKYLGLTDALPSRWSSPFLGHVDYTVQQEDLWKITKFLVSLLRNTQLMEQARYSEFSGLYKINEFDISAYHTLAYLILERLEPNSPEYGNIRSALANVARKYPVVSEPPSEKIRDFWLNINDTTELQSYIDLDVASQYKKTED